MAIFFCWFVFSLVAGVVGMDRKIGFWGAFFLSLFLSPLIGLIIAFASKNNTPEDVVIVNQEPPIKQESSDKQELKSNDSIDRIREAYELKQKGALTEEEFQTIKKRLL
jgi:phosphate/sulfate permease